MDHPPRMRASHHLNLLRPYAAEHARVLHIQVDGIEELAAKHVLEHKRVVHRECKRGMQRGQGGVHVGRQALFLCTSMRA